MKDPKEFSKSYKLRKKQGVPKGVNPDKHERCVQDVKRKGHDKTSAIKICSSSMNKSKEEFIDNFKKSSYDFRNVAVSVDAGQQAHAETTASPELVEYLKRSIESDLEKIPMEKGILTVFKKDEGLYSGYFADREGQVIEKFDDMTIPILAKNLEIKSLYACPVPVDEMETKEEVMSDVEDRIVNFLEHHNRIYHRGQDPGEPINGGKGSLRIKMGDIDIEIKKSINSFVNEYKKSRTSKQVDIIKAIQSWRRNSVEGKSHNSNLDAAQALLRDWEKYCEEFYQIMHAMRQMRNE